MPSSLEARAHARPKQRVSFVRVQRRATFKDVDEFVLLGVGVPQRRHGPRKQAREVDAEVAQAEEISEWMLEPTLHPGRERLGVDRTLRAHGGLGGDDGKWRLHFPVASSESQGVRRIGNSIALNRPDRVPSMRATSRC